MSDVDTSTNPPNEDSILQWTPSTGNWEPRDVLPCFTIFPIWAEENGPIADNTNEWSFGNGAVGAGIGIPVPIDCEIFAVGYQAEVAGTNSQVGVEVNNVIVTNTGPQSGNSGLNTLSTPISVSAGDVVGFMTQTGGGASDVRVVAWLRALTVDKTTYQFDADQVDSPNTADWAVNAFAPAAPDSANTGIRLRRFDDTTEEGIGLTFRVPPTVSSIKIQLVSKPETSAASNLDVVPRIYTRVLGDNIAVPAWSAGTDMAAITMGTSNVFPQYDEETFTLGALGLAADRYVQLQLTRNTASGSDTLVGDWGLISVKVSFS